ncbi:phospholipase-like protein [Tanacetum coccineum]
MGHPAKNIEGSSNSEGITAIVSKLDNLGRDMKKLKENVHAIQVGCQNCRGAHLDKDCLLNEEVKSVEKAKYGEFRLPSPISNGAKYRVGPPGYYTRIDNRPPFGEKRPSLEELMNKHLEESTRRRAEMEEWVKKLQENAVINTRNQSASLKNLETQIEQLTKEFHTKAANEINNSSFDHCKAVYADKKTPHDNGQHEKIDMLVEMTDMTKRSPIGIVENVLVKIDKFLFPLDFVVMDMLNTRNETMILRRPFLATIHVEIDVFNNEISLGIGGDKVTFDMNKKIHNFTTPIGEIYMINSTYNNEYTSHTSSDASSRVEKTDGLHNENNYCNQKQGRSCKKPRKLKFDINLPNTHFCKPIKQILKGELKFWPTCDPNIKECNGGPEIYGMDEEGVIKKWYCYHDDDMKRINGGGLSFPEFLLVKYGETQEKELIWDDRFEEWCNSNPNTPTSRVTTVQENLNPRPKDYPFKDWLLTKIGHTNISEPVKKTLLKTWLIDCFREDLVKDPRERSFDDYKWMFDLEVDQLADEYELGIGKKGHMLDDIWENCKKVQGDNTYWWHDQKSEEEERRELGINIEEYDPPIVHVETFEIKRYSFDSGQNFICVTKELMDALPFGRENGASFRDMIRTEVDSGRRIHRKT